MMYKFICYYCYNSFFFKEEEDPTSSSGCCILCGSDKWAIYKNGKRVDA